MTKYIYSILHNTHHLKNMLYVRRTIHALIQNNAFMFKVHSTCDTSHNSVSKEAKITNKGNNLRKAIILLTVHV